MNRMNTDKLTPEQQRERLELVIEGTRLGMWDWNPQTNEVAFNDIWAEMLGYSIDEISPSLEEWESRVHPDDLAACYADIQAHIEGKTPFYENVHRMKHRNGSWVYILDRGRVVQRNEQGLPIRFTRTHTDITNQKKSEEREVISTRDITALKEIKQKLVKSETRFKDFAEIAADFLWETDKNLNFTYLSEKQEYITHYPAEHWLGKSYLEFLKPLITNQELYKEQQQLVLQQQPFDLELPLQRSDNTVFMVRIIAKPVIVKGEFDGYRGVGRNITESYTLAKQLKYQASYDALTGLVNRRAFDLLLQKALNEARNDQQQHILCYIDLDQFKIVNDTVGHAAGDKLLKQVSGLFKSGIRSSDILARLGGDEFVLLMKNCSLNKGITIADKLIADLNSYSFHQQEQHFKVGASIGLVAITPETESTTQIMSQADVACYAAKDGGRNCVHVYKYNNEDNKLSELHAELINVNDIRNALEKNLFCLYYQYIKPLDSSSGLEPYYELLLRLKDESGSLVSPGSFIPAAERYNLMIDIDKWVIRTALVEMQDIFAQLPKGSIAINLSGNSLNDQKLLKFVKSQFQESNIAPKRICFEITETAAISNLNEALSFIKEMRDFGCQFALDDFGSGFSSFIYLTRFKVDYLKIDGNLVRTMTVDNARQAMVKAINDIGHAMEIYTIAEFVETEADIALLKQLKVDYAQGYAISRPAPLETLSD